MAEVDPEDDTIERFIVRNYAYDPMRRERRQIEVAAFDNEADMLKRLREGISETDGRKARGEAADGERWTGVV
jgi:hypothetical protein